MSPQPAALLLGTILGALASSTLPVALAQEDGQNRPPDAEAEAVPWEGASDVALPPFLQDTGKRVVA